MGETYIESIFGDNAVFLLAVEELDARGCNIAIAMVVKREPGSMKYIKRVGDELIALIGMQGNPILKYDEKLDQRLELKGKQLVAHKWCVMQP